MGHMFTAREVYHDQTQKNYGPYYDGSISPPYASGAGYVLSMSLVQPLADLSTLGPGLRLLRNEDAALGMWLVGLNVSFKHDSTFWPEPSSECVRDATLLHRQSIHQMELLSKGKLESDICKNMVFFSETRFSYAKKTRISKRFSCKKSTVVD